LEEKACIGGIAPSQGCKCEGTNGVTDCKRAFCLGTSSRKLWKLFKVSELTKSEHILKERKKWLR
jgi:hypothetical protein